MTEADIIDLRSVVNEQFDLIQRLSKTPLNHVANYRDYQTIYNDVQTICNPERKDKWGMIWAL